MLKFGFAILAISMCSALPVAAEAPICHHCEEIRLYNAEHHKNYEYYEDFLKTEGGAATAAEQKTPSQEKNIADKNVPKI